jgi:hypothetical protein
MSPSSAASSSASRNGKNVMPSPYAGHPR